MVTTHLNIDINYAQIFAAAALCECLTEQATVMRAEYYSTIEPFDLAVH